MVLQDFVLAGNRTLSPCTWLLRNQESRSCGLKKVSTPTWPNYAFVCVCVLLCLLIDFAVTRSSAMPEGTTGS